VCCESCILYERCLENDKLKDECCSRCPEFSECSGTERTREDSRSSSDDYEKEEDYY
jgi:hypothetical protein